MVFKAILKEPHIFSRQEIKREIWENLPIWFFYLEALGVLHFMMANVDPVQYQLLDLSVLPFALTAILPLAWVVGYYLLRIRNSDRLPNKSYYSVVIPALLAAPLVFIYLFYSLFPVFRTILDPEGLRTFFEIMQLFWIVVFVFHGLLHRGKHKFVTFYVVGFVYGLVLENAGIIFGYFFEPHYLFYLWRLPAPFATMMGWCLVFYCCIWLAEFVRDRVAWFQGSPLRSALLTTSIALSLDFQLDPLASLSGVFWRWNELLPPWFLGVPFCNFVAWFGAFLPFAWAYFYLIDRQDLSDTQKNWKLFVHVPLIAVIAGMIWLVFMTIFEGGFSGPTYQILQAFFDRILPYPT